jgi:hypothetical protein
VRKAVAWLLLATVRAEAGKALRLLDERAALGKVVLNVR